MESDSSDEMDYLSLKVKQLLSYDPSDPSQEIPSYLFKRSENDAKSHVSDKENNVFENANRSAKNLDASVSDISGCENSDVTFKGTIEVFGHSLVSQTLTNMKINVETVPENIHQLAVKGFIREGKNGTSYKEREEKFTQTTPHRSPDALEKNNIPKLTETFKRTEVEVKSKLNADLYFLKDELEEVAPMPLTTEDILSQINEIKEYLAKVETAIHECKEMIDESLLRNIHGLQDNTGFKNYLDDVLKQFYNFDSRANLRCDHLHMMLKLFNSFPDTLDYKISDIYKEMDTVDEDLIKIKQKNLKNRINSTVYYLLKELEEIPSIPRTIEGIESQINDIKDYLAKVETAKDECKDMFELWIIDNYGLQDYLDFPNYLDVVLTQFKYLHSRAKLRYDHLHYMLNMIESFSDTVDFKLGDKEDKTNNVFEDLMTNNERNLKINCDPLWPQAPEQNTCKTHRRRFYNSYYNRNAIKSRKEKINHETLLDQKKCLKIAYRKRITDFSKVLRDHGRKGKINFHPYDIIFPNKKD